MPEVCEITLMTQALNYYFKGKQITNIIRHYNGKFNGFTNIIYPLKINIIDSKGKFLWFELMDNDNNKTYILNTLGLTGEWTISIKGLMGDGIDKGKQRNTIIEIIFNNSNDKIYFNDTRHFGTLEYDNTSIEFNKKFNKLSNDLLKTNFTNKMFETWTNNIKNKSKNIYSILLEQDGNNSIGSGIGNYLVAEILYRAKLSPHRTIESLSLDDIHILSNTIKKVLKQCYIYNETHYIDNIKDFMKIHLGKIIDGIFPDYHSEIPLNTLEHFTYEVYQKTVDHLGNKVVGEKILNGRTAYWCPTIQK